MSCKSVISHPFLKCAYFRIFIILLFWFTISSQQEPYNYKQMEIIDDLPVKKDLDKYLSVLEKIVYFVDSHRFYVDIDLCFGIYLVNVNLRGIVHSRGHFLTFQKQVRMMHLVKTNDDIVLHYSKIHKNHTFYIGTNVLVNLLNLYPNHSIIWPHLTQKFNTDLLMKTRFYSRKNLELLYFKFPKYKEIIFEFRKGYPTPTESDHCLNLLAQNPVNEQSEYFHCQVPYNCLNMILKGDDFGYGINHRLLFLLGARYWRTCVILSLQDDKQMIDTLCAKMYNELEYLANHEFKLPDLFMEHISLCSLEGHGQFLRRSWIDELIDFQTESGCFNLTRPNYETPVTSPTRSKRRNTTDYYQMCNSHVTGVAAAMLGAAIRLIMENYF